MRKILGIMLMMIALSFIGQPALTEPLPDIREEALLDALKSSMPLHAYPNCELIAAGYFYCGQETNGNTRRIYMAASVAGFGFMGDAFVMQSGWGGPCTVVFVYRQNAWHFEKLLKVESWNDVHTIMPPSAIKKWKSYDGDTFVEEVILRQAQDYLESIGRTEPARDYGDTGFNLSGMYVPASNFLSWIDWAYPLGVGTRERLDQRTGERYLYTKAWQPSPDGPINPIIITKHGEMTLEGSSGTETLTKMRKSDGKVLETTKIVVELDKLTVSMGDEWGSVKYVFPFDPREISYRKPVITREGACRMDSRGIDRSIEDLPGEKQSVSVEEASVVVREGERFTVLKDGSINTLVYSRLTEGAWQEVWRNDKLLPRTNQKIYMRAHPSDEPSLHEMPRHSVMRLSSLSIYTGEEHPDLSIDLFVNEQNVWQVHLYDWAGDELYAELFEDGVFINFAPVSAYSIGGFTFTPVYRGAAAFDAYSIFTAREKVNTGIEGAPQWYEHCGLFGGAEPMYINLKKDVRLPVYASSDCNGPQAAGGKAAVSLNDWVIVLAKQGNAMCIVYEITSDKYRAGWVDAAQDPQLQQLLDITMTAWFEADKQGIVLNKTNLFDDPFHDSGHVLTLKKGDKIRILEEKEGIWYVEATQRGKAYWGFVNAADVGFNP